nr:MAG TPA: hypothetical protein [Caudoviricetes sp.]
MTFEDIDQLEAYVGTYVPAYTFALSTIGQLNKNAISLLEKAKSLEDFKQEFQSHLDTLTDKLISANDILPDDSVLEQTWKICSSTNRIDKVVKQLYLKSKCEVDPFTFINGVKYACESGLTVNKLLDLIVSLKREGFYGNLDETLTKLRGIEEHKQLVVYTPRPKQDQNKKQNNKKDNKMHNDFFNQNFHEEFNREFNRKAAEFHRQFEEQVEEVRKEERKHKIVRNVLIGLNVAALGCVSYVAYKIFSERS